MRLRKVRELAPDEAIRSNSGWQAHRLETQDVPEAQLDDLSWADVVIFGSPTRYGMVAAQLKQFIDTTGPLWAQGALANKVYSGFTSTATSHGGQETTLLSLFNVFYHWGGVVVDPRLHRPEPVRRRQPVRRLAHQQQRRDRARTTSRSGARADRPARGADLGTALKAGMAG